MKGENCMEVLENADNTYEWLKNIPVGECFRNISNGWIYLKTQSTRKRSNGEHDILYHEILTYGCVDLSTGMLYYIENVKVLPVHATVIIGHNSSLKKEGTLDD